jgi:RecA-family ATPase
LLDRLHEFFPQNIDKQVKDLARIMRVPLSQNIKYESPIDTEVWFYNGIRFPAKFMEDFLLKFKPEEEKPEEVEKLIEAGKLERKLKKYQRDRIVEVISNFWLPGFRNAMEMSLVGLLIKNGISYPHAEDIVKRICLKTHDEEVKQRLKNLEYHYKHRVELGEKLKGSKGIAEIIWEILNSEIPEELLKDKPELQKLISLKNKGGLIRDDIDDYVSSLLRSLGLTRDIFKDEGIKTYSLTELLQMSREDVDYIVDKLIPKKSLVIIGGRPESFKSIFSLLLGVSCALGEKFLKFQTKKSRVLYVDAENGENIISQRLAYFYGDNIKTEDFRYYYFEDFNLLKTLITREKFDLVIFDSFRRFLKGSEVESDVINKFYQGFLKPLRDAGATIILIHHFRKRKAI